MDDAEEAEDGRREERERAPHEARSRRSATAAPQITAVMTKPLPRSVRARSVSPVSPPAQGRRAEERPGLERRDERERRQRRDRDGGRVTGRGRGERLREDLDADVDQDRRDRRGGDPVHEERQVPEDPAEADEEARATA